MLKALSYEPVDHIPCCFMSFTALRQRCHENMYELTKAELAMGFDSMLFIPYTSRDQRPEHPDLRGLPVRFHPSVKIKEWHESVQGIADSLQKEYETPAGRLTTRVQLSEDWPHGDHIPFLDDYQIPRSVKPLICGIEDLSPLQFLLYPPQEEQILQFQEEARRAHDFSEEYGILLVGGWGVGMDLACWLCGIQNLTMLTIDQPAFVSRLLEMIHVWNMQRMQVILSAPVDLFIRRAWYEGCDFVTPKFYNNEILPRLKTEVELAHTHGAKFGYIITSGTKPMLDYYLEAGIDVLIGVDPIQGTYTDMPLMKKKLDKRICLWGGVSGAVTIEMGTEEQIRSETRKAINTLGPTGLILSPVDNITLDVPLTWRNIEVFKEVWRSYSDMMTSSQEGENND
jgi:uroporphyrinogen-III decarboxylase